MNLDILRRQLPDYRRLNARELGALAEELDPVRRVALATVLDAELAGQWFPRAGRLQAVLDAMPTDAPTVAAMKAVALEGREPRRLDTREQNDKGDCEARLALATAEALAVHAPHLMTPGERTDILRAMDAGDKAALLVTLHARGPDANSESRIDAARGAVRQACPMTPELFRRSMRFFAGFEEGADPQRTLLLQQRVGTALAAAVTEERFRFDPLPALTAAQSLVAPALTRSTVGEDAVLQLDRFYRAAHDIPEFTAFGTELGQRMAQRLVYAGQDEASLYTRGIHRWDELHEPERGAVMQQLLNDMADAMDMPAPQLRIVDFSVFGRDERHRGFAKPREGAPGHADIFVNNAGRFGAMSSFASTVELLVHEFTHCHQEVLRHCPSEREFAQLGPAEQRGVAFTWTDNPTDSALAPLMRANAEHYVPADTGLSAYRLQPMEREAFATAEVATPYILSAMSSLAFRTDPRYVLATAAQALPVLEDIALVAGPEHGEGAPGEAPLLDAVQDLRSRIEALGPGAGRDGGNTARTVLRDLSGLMQRGDKALLALRADWGHADLRTVVDCGERFRQVQRSVQALQLGLLDPRARNTTALPGPGAAPHDLKGRRYHP